MGKKAIVRFLPLLFWYIIEYMNNAFNWYQTLIKPSWAPPSWLFGPVWTFLYILIAISFGYVGYLYLKKRVSFKVILPFVLNLIFNLIFSPIQFGLQNNLLASVDILLISTTLIWSIAVIYRHAKWVAWINIPYLVWVLFATVLQLTVTYLNL
jgi:translocator protein